jgi:ribosomal protein S12 methylthiotransferase accessory factor
MDLLDSMVDRVLLMGHDILVRDVSNLGFPSYHVIIPEMSEMQDVSDIMVRSNNTRFLVAQLLNNPKLINKDNCKYIIGTMKYFGPSHIENAMKLHYGFPIKFSLPAEEMGIGWVYLSAMCYALSGDYKKAADEMKDIVAHAEKNQNEDTAFYRAVFYYLDGMAAMNDNKKAMKYLRLMFQKDICEKVNLIFENPEAIITKQYPFHRTSLIGRCNNSDCCEVDELIHCIEQLRKKQVSNPIEQDGLQSLFQKSD